MPSCRPTHSAGSGARGEPGKVSYGSGSGEGQTSGLWSSDLGVALEALHGLKSAFYLDPAYTLRRELWTLAHAHGTLFALVNLVWASHLGQTGPRFTARRLALTSHLLLDGSLLIPLGFFLGGAFATEHDPWSGVLLVPVGAVCLLLAIGMTALESRRR